MQEVMSVYINRKQMQYNISEEKKRKRDKEGSQSQPNVEISTASFSWIKKSLFLIPIIIVYNICKKS